MGKSYNAEALGRQNVKEVLANKDFRAADVANLRGAISEVYRRRCEGALATEMGLRDGYDRAKAHRAQVRQRWHAGRCTSYFLIPWYSYLGNPTRERRERIDWSYYDVGQLARELGIEPTP